MNPWALIRGATVRERSCQNEAVYVNLHRRTAAFEDKRMLKRLAFFPVLLAVCLAQQASHSPIDRASLDPSCKPCQDFWRYANGGWLDKNPIPARFPSWGPASVLSEETRARLREILETSKGS